MDREFGIYYHLGVVRMNILIRELPEYEVAFFRRVGSYTEPNGEHWEKLLNWAIKNGLFPPQQSFIGISLDNPDLVESHKCRHDACVTLLVVLIEKYIKIYILES